MALPLRAVSLCGAGLLLRRRLCAVRYAAGGAALALGQGADEFLGTQGDPWDTQSDMFCALLGAIAGQWLFGGWQGRQLRRLKE